MQAKVIGGDVYKQCKNIQKKNALTLSEEKILSNRLYMWLSEFCGNAANTLLDSKLPKLELLTERPSHNSSQ